MARIDEFNKGARDEGFKSWVDLRDRLKKKDYKVFRLTIQRIHANLKRNKGKYKKPLTVAEKVARASQALVIHTWDSVTKEYPDFKDALNEYLNNRTTKPELKRIGKLKISPEKKWNMMSGDLKQFILRFNADQFQRYKNTLTTPQMGELSNFKSIRDVLVPTAGKTYHTENGVVQFDQHFYKLNRAQRFQDYIKEQGIEEISLPSKKELERGTLKWQIAGKEKPVGGQKRWKLTDKAIKEGKTFASILKSFPNLGAESSLEYSEILAKISRNHPIYKDTQRGLRSLLDFVQVAINDELKSVFKIRIFFCY